MMTFFRRLFGMAPPATGPEQYACISLDHAPEDDYNRLKCRSLDAVWGSGPTLNWGGGLCTPLPDGFLVLIDRYPACLKGVGLAFSRPPAEEVEVEFSRPLLENLYRLYCKKILAVRFRVLGPFCGGLMTFAGDE